MRYSHTVTHLLLKLTLSFNASGAVHLTGNFPPSWGTWIFAFLASPKSEIFAWPLLFRRTFLAAKSLETHPNSYYEIVVQISLRVNLEWADCSTCEWSLQNWCTTFPHKHPWQNSRALLGKWLTDLEKQDTSVKNPMREQWLKFCEGNYSNLTFPMSSVRMHFIADPWKTSPTSWTRLLCCKCLDVTGEWRTVFQCITVPWLTLTKQPLAGSWKWLGHFASLHGWLSQQSACPDSWPYTPLQTPLVPVSCQAQLPL